MPFEILRNDITCMHCDAIVNTANPRPIIGNGCDAGIHAKAGPQLLAARKAIGEIAVGSAAITPAFGLDAKFVIHAVSPAWQDGTRGEEALLRKTYVAALALALENGCESIAFPLLAAGNYAFPHAKAMGIAISAISEFLALHEMQVYLTVFHPKVFSLSEKLFPAVASFVDEHYVDEKLKDEGVFYSLKRRQLPHRKEEAEADFTTEDTPFAEPFAERRVAAPCPAACPPSFEEFTAQLDDGFSKTLLNLIDASGRTDPEVYKRANVDRKLFSKIRTNPNYKPSKTTALAFAIALELDLEKTKDLIGRAGFALTRSSKLDLIVEFFITQGNYNIHEINAALFEHDQCTLGLY